MKPWKSEAVEYYGWWPLLGEPIIRYDPPRARVFWYQATMGEGIATWECPCGATGFSLCLTWARLRLWHHLRRCSR